jgi:hypothetical protein
MVIISDQCLVIGTARNQQLVGYACGFQQNSQVAEESESRFAQYI